MLSKLAGGGVPVLSWSISCRHLGALSNCGLEIDGERAVLFELLLRRPRPCEEELNLVRLLHSGGNYCLLCAIVLVSDPTLKNCLSQSVLFSSTYVYDHCGTAVAVEVVLVRQLKEAVTYGPTWCGIWEIASAQVSSLSYLLLNFLCWCSL